MTLQEMELAISKLITLHQESHKTIEGLLEVARLASANAQIAVEMSRSTLERVDKLTTVIESYIRSIQNGKGGQN